jgi:hypothetical protein
MQDQSTPTQLPQRWREQASQLRSLGADAQARLLETVADQLAAAFLRAGDEPLGLQRAAQESGYSVDHLGRMLREGRIPNSGRKDKPLIRRGDLPLKGRKRKVDPCRLNPSGYVPDKLSRDIIHSKLGGGDAQD